MLNITFNSLSSINTSSILSSIVPNGLDLCFCDFMSDAFGCPFSSTAADFLLREVDMGAELWGENGVGVMGWMEKVGCCFLGGTGVNGDRGSYRWGPSSSHSCLLHEQKVASIGTGTM